MKVATSTIVLATFCCTAAFGLNGAATKSGIAKKIGFAVPNRKPMVQAIDVQGQRISMVRAAGDTLTLGWYRVSRCTRRLVTRRGCSERGAHSSVWIALMVPGRADLRSLRKARFRCRAR
jgi:hypothetical protein